VIVITLIVIFSLYGLAFAQPSKPENFPKRPITLIVPYSSGGGSDAVTRAIAEPLSKVVGVPVSVVNKPGGTGVAGLSDFMMARKDGYTLVEQFDQCASLYATGKIKWNPAEDYFPLCIAQITFNQIYVRPSDPRFPNWDAYVKAAKKNPGKLTMANIAGKGDMESIVMWQLQNALGFKVKQISFLKPAERYSSVIGKHVDSLFEQPGDVRAYLESGDIKPILSILRERPKSFSSVPCYKDIGVTFDPMYRFRGFFVAKGVPQDRIEYLEWAFRKAWESKEFQEHNRIKYMDVIDSYRDMKGGREVVSSMVTTYREALKKMGIN
jgi:tripartite-type tricarboxylate transporter receptor subunit TctC